MSAPAARDPALVVKRLEEWLAARMPGARAVRVRDLERPAATGFSSDTLLITLAWEEGGVRHEAGRVVRMAPAGHAVFPSYDLGRQHGLLCALRALGIPVPRTFGAEADASVLGSPFFVMERVAGCIAPDNPTYHQAGWMTEVPPEERAAIWWSGVETLARIHQVDWRALSPDLVEPPPDEGSLLDRELARWERYLAWAAPRRPQPTLERGLAWLRAHRPREPEPLVLSWGDARLGNMIFRDGRCVAVLDWEMAGVASPEADLAWWLFFDRHHSEAAGVPRLEGLPSREETVARYEAWTGHRVRNLAFYEAFAALRFSMIMIRVCQGIVGLGLLPEDTPFESDNSATRLLAELTGQPPPAQEAAP